MTTTEQLRGERWTEDRGGDGPGGPGGGPVARGVRSAAAALPTAGSGWRPLSGAALLERLRVTGRPRPAADPGLAADLRAHLEHGLDGPAGPVPGRGPVDDAGPRRGTGAPLVVTARRLTRALACPVHATGDPLDECGFSLPLACGALVDVLFRQLVTTGAIGDALTDGMAGLAVDDHRAPLVAWIGQLAPTELSELRSEVERQADGLRRRWPALDPAWLPRTHERIRVPLAGGAVELVAHVDLALGRPGGDEASVALVDVTSGSRRPSQRDDRHLHALIETLRSTTPPFAVATYYTRTGELDVDPVTPELLVDAARRCRSGIRALTGPAAVAVPVVDHRPWCAGCAEALRPVIGPSVGTGRVPVHAPVPPPVAVAPLVAAGGQRGAADRPEDTSDGVVPVAEGRAA